MLHVNDDYANNYARGLRDNSPEHDVRVVATASYTTNVEASYEPACASLKASGVNVVVVAAWSHDLAQILKVCKARGLWGQGYAWISADAANAAPSLSAGANFGQTLDETAALLDGMLHFLASPESTAGYSRFQADWLTRNASDCANPFFNASEHPEIFTQEAWNVAAYAYDCVVTFAAAMSAAVDPADGVEVAAKFRQVQFDGASGIVKFDAVSDREQSSINYVLYNWVANGTTIASKLAGTIAVGSALQLKAGYNMTWHESAFTPIDRMTLSECAAGLVRDTSTGVPLCVPCPGDRVASGGTDCVPKTAQIGMIMPITNNPTGEFLSQDFLSLTCAAKLAVKHVNERSNVIVRGLSDLVVNLTRLDASLYDTGFSESPAIDSYRQLITSGERALVGAARSAVSQPLATLGKIDKLPQCSYWSSSPSLSNKLLYPYCAPRAAVCSLGVPSRAMLCATHARFRLVLRPPDRTSWQLAERTRPTKGRHA